MKDILSWRAGEQRRHGKWACSYYPKKLTVYGGKILIDVAAKLAYTSYSKKKKKKKRPVKTKPIFERP